MSKLLISYINGVAGGEVTTSSEHPSFPVENVQQRWFKKPWRSRYGTGSGWGNFTFTASDGTIHFNEGGGTLTAIITIGDYDVDTLCTEIKTRMDASGAVTYTVTYNETTNKFVISGSGNFELELDVSTNAAWEKLGFTSGVATGLGTEFTADEIRIHTGEHIYIDLGSTSTLRLIGIKGHNLQSSATVTIIYYSDAFLTPVDTETLTWNEDQIAIRTNQSYRYFAYYVNDPDNPDGFIEIGLTWAGDAAQLHYGFNSDRNMAPEDPSIVSVSEDGQESSIYLSHYDEKTYTFDGVEPNTDRPYLLSVFEEIGKTRPCMLVISPPVTGDVSTKLEYVRVVDWEWSHVAGNFWSLDITTRGER